MPKAANSCKVTLAQEMRFNKKTRKILDTTSKPFNIHTIYKCVVVRAHDLTSIEGPLEIRCIKGPKAWDSEFHSS